MAERADTSAVRVESAGPVTTVILHRPETRNAVDRATADALAEAFRSFEADPGARVAVLWGEGGTFCSGADLKALAAGEGNRLEPPGIASDGDVSDPEDAPLGPTRMRLSKPVIAAVAGHAVAGGLELALWCDLRVLEETAVFGVFCRRWGVPLVDGGTVRLPRLIGLSRALDLILTGRPVDAREAERIGLAHRVVEEGRGRAAAEELARQLAGLPQECLRSDRLSTYEGLELPFGEAMARELRRGLATVEATGLRDVERFVAGEGRGGAPLRAPAAAPAGSPAAEGRDED